MLIRVKPVDPTTTSSIAKSEPDAEGGILIEHADLGAALAHGYVVAHLEDLPPADEPEPRDPGEGLKPIGERAKRR